MERLGTVITKRGSETIRKEKVGFKNPLKDRKKLRERLEIENIEQLLSIPSV